MILSYRDLHKGIFKHNYVIYFYWKSVNVLPITCSVWVGTDEGFVVAIELEELTCEVIPDVMVLGMAVVWLFTVSAAFDKNLSFKIISLCWKGMHAVAQINRSPLSIYVSNDEWRKQIWYLYQCMLPNIPMYSQWFTELRTKPTHIMTFKHIFTRLWRSLMEHFWNMLASVISKSAGRKLKSEVDSVNVIEKRKK